jgi:hypothetical protein
MALKIFMDNKISQTEKTIESLLLNRYCPVCRKSNCIKITDKKVFFKESADFMGTCSLCNERFSLYLMDDETRPPRVLLCIKSDGWKSCDKCFLRFKDQEMLIDSSGKGRPSCPGCGYPDLFQEKNPQPVMPEELYKTCPICSSEIESFRYYHNLQFRDGMTGDYVRTTDYWLRYCPECRVFTYLAAEENTKFGPITKIEAFIEYPPEYAERIIHAYDESLGKIKSRSSYP